MAEIDFTKLEFNEAVSTAMKEFDLDEQDATEFINLIHGKGPNIMTEKEITTKAGTSEGVKRSWLSRARGRHQILKGMGPKEKALFRKHRGESAREGPLAVYSAGLGAAGLLGGHKVVAGLGFANAARHIAKGVKREPLRWLNEEEKRRSMGMKPRKYTGKEITTKAGNSEGVKKGWLSRRRGGGGLGKKIVGAATFAPRKTFGAAKKIAGAGAKVAGAGARAYASGVKKSIPFKVAKKVGGAYASAGKKTFGVGKKIAGAGAQAYVGGVRKSIPFKVAKKVGGAYARAGKKTFGFAKKKLTGKELSTKGTAEGVRKSWITRRAHGINRKVSAATDKFRAFQKSNAGQALGTAAKVGAVTGVIGLGLLAANSKRGRGFISTRVVGHGTTSGGSKWHETASLGHTAARALGAAGNAARRVKPKKMTYEYGGKLRSGVTYHHALSPRITHYGSKETSLMARVDNIRSDVSKSVGEDYFIADIYDGYAVVSAWKENTYYKVPYMETKDGVTVAAKDQWTEVEKSWEEVESKEISSLTITKDANDKWRWTLFSTNSFEDRDGEVISKKGLETDLAISEKEFEIKGNYGPLRWWHVVTGEDPVKDGLEIGTCDFRGMEDRVMIESGPFLSEEIGEALAPHAKELGGSIGFKHSTSEPDSDKVFHSIRIFERSLLPLERASNPLARLIIQKEGGIMQKEKIDKLTELLGGKDKAEKVLGAAKEAQDKADAEGIRNKETQVVETKDEGQVVDASEELTQEEWDGFVEAVGEALSELLPENDEPEGDVENKEVNELKAALKEQNSVSEKLVDALGKLDTRLKELEGGQPTSKPHVASESKDTITTNKNHSEPAPDPLNSFMDSFVLKK